jgi:hypothetical protein
LGCVGFVCVACLLAILLVSTVLYCFLILLYTARVVLVGFYLLE